MDKQIIWKNTNYAYYSTWEMWNKCLRNIANSWKNIQNQRYECVIKNTTSVHLTQLKEMKVSQF